ncbi:MAG: putative phosphomethylpyrimidine kinase [Frankiales bacterium]|nr:putative phosphomethylpyrimidine kinase [Frankiales bacterium]
MKTVLAIGGSDSGGGAGIQADLKALHTLGVHASTVITAVTAQSTTGVHDQHLLSADVVGAQLRAVLDDIGADVIKTGMLGSAEVVDEVVRHLGSRPLVVDPVGVSSTGQSLLTADGLIALRDRLLPQALVVTPNLAEVEALTGVVVSTGNLEDAAQAVHDLGPRWVVITGGHLEGPPHDLLYGEGKAIELRGTRVDTTHTHGSGCTFASALAGYLALGHEVPDAAQLAKALTARAIAAGYPVGRGAGPVRQG